MDINDRLYEILKPFCSDAVIARGPRLTERGLKKVAAALGCSSEEVKSHIARLADHMTKARAIDEDIGERFSYEADQLGHITVRDSKTSQEKFLTGQDAAKLKKDLLNQDEQSVLAQQFALTESADDITADELAKDFGTFNFPHEGNMATVAYSVQNGQPHLEVVSLRDHRGNEVELSEGLKIALTAQAVKWIPNV